MTMVVTVQTRRRLFRGNIAVLRCLCRPRTERIGTVRTVCVSWGLKTYVLRHTIGESTEKNSGNGDRAQCSGRAKDHTWGSVPGISEQARAALAARSVTLELALA